MRIKLFFFIIVALMISACGKLAPAASACQPGGFRPDYTQKVEPGVFVGEWSSRQNANLWWNPEVRGNALMDIYPGQSFKVISDDDGAWIWGNSDFTYIRVMKGNTVGWVIEQAGCWH